jgi:hypothetical protein
MAKPTTGIFNDKVFMENNPNKLFDTHYDIIDAVRIRSKSYVWNRQTFSGLATLSSISPAV